MQDITTPGKVYKSRQESILYHCLSVYDMKFASEKTKFSITKFLLFLMFGPVEF